MIGETLNIPIKILTIISIVMAIFVSCLSVMNLRKLMLENKDAKSLFSKFLVTVIAFSAIFNFMYIENLYFIEAIIMALAVFFSIIAAEKLIIRDKKNILKSLIYLLLAVFCYNGAISIYAATVCMLLVIKRENTLKNDIKILLNACIFCVITLAFNLIQIKIVCHYLNITQNRINGLTSILFNFSYIVSYWWKVLVETSKLFPKYLFLVFMVIFFAICFFQKRTWKNHLTKSYSYLHYLV